MLKNKTTATHFGGEINNGRQPVIKALLGSNIFGLFIGGIYEYLSLRGVVSMKLAWLVLIFAWGVGVIGIVLSEWIWGQEIRHKVRWGIVGSVVLAALLLAIHVSVNSILIHNKVEAKAHPISLPQSQPTVTPKPEPAVNCPNTGPANATAPGSIAISGCDNDLSPGKSK